jgi:uncharacterized membrane protein
MSESAVFVFQSETDTYEMDDTIHQPKKNELMTFDDAIVVICKLDSKIKVKPAVHLMGTGIVGGAFWGILIGMCALVILIAKWTKEKALEILNKFKATVMHPSLSHEDELKLKAVFGVGK